MSLTIHFNIHSLCIIVDKDADKALGTGFVFIRPNWIVTAKHVVVEDDGIRNNLQLLHLNKKPVSTSVLFVHPIYDLAVLATDSLLCQKPLFPSYEEFTGIKGLICCGYSPSKSTENELSFFVNSVPNYQLETRSRDYGDEKLLFFDAPFAEGGHSGGPLLGEGAGVVAVVIEGFNSNDQYIVKATSILPLLEFLKF
ncbi:MAG: trypsin-like peptidase domain-containing protein [Acidobacteria bacterium]|nr:trypsin-like peptidase domain-containing protein [Acidobacteriota bacterium]